MRLLYIVGWRMQIFRGTFSIFSFHKINETAIIFVYCQIHNIYNSIYVSDAVYILNVLFLKKINLV